MIRKLGLTLLVAFTALSVLGAKVTTVKDALSPSGYRTTFEYADEAATDVRVSGSFSFYKDNNPMLFGMSAIISTRNDSAANYIYGPEAWAEGGMRHIGGNRDIAMSKEDGVWTCSVELPSACYQYTFSVSYDGGESWSRVMDPDNLPEQNAYAVGKQGSSRFFVPYDAEKQSPEDDWTFLMPYEGERGTIEYFTYEGVGGTRPSQVYLPYGYDEERDVPYKTLYLVHGGMGSEGDWFFQGNADNIADRLIAAGTVEPFVIVTMEIDTFKLSTKDPSYNGLNPDYRALVKDIRDSLIPAVEERYNVSEKGEDRAVAGLSLGANISTAFLFRSPETFGSYGLFSCGSVNLYSVDTDPELMKDKNIYLGGGFADMAFMRRNFHQDEVSSTLGMAWLLDNLGVDYNNKGSLTIVPGAHDWFTWPQLLCDFISGYLWK